MPKSKNPDRKPTWTSLVLAALVAADDFMSMPQLMAATGGAYNQISAALWHLARRHAVESVVGGDDQLWWFATPATDDRLRHVDERTPEEKGTRNRKRRITVKKPD